MKTIDDDNQYLKENEHLRTKCIVHMPMFSICSVHGYLNGEHEYCPKCDDTLIKLDEKILKSIN